MENYYGGNWEAAQQRFISSGKANAFLQQIYVTMALGLGITGLTAYSFGNDLLAGEYLWLFTSPLKWLLIFAPLGLVVLLSAGINRMSFSTASLVFGLYALLNGLAISCIFVIYTQTSISSTFFITGGTFAAMAAVGTLTKIDLSKFSSFFLMAFIGLIIAGVVNIFLKSTMFNYIISGAGVLIFCGLTAYDVQKLMQMGVEADMQNDNIRKLTVLGALTLYLDFLNLFMYLLRFFGNRRD